MQYIVKDRRIRKFTRGIKPGLILGSSHPYQTYMLTARYDSRQARRMALNISFYSMTCTILTTGLQHLATISFRHRMTKAIRATNRAIATKTKIAPIRMLDPEKASLKPLVSSVLSERPSSVELARLFSSACVGSPNGSEISLS